MTDMISFVLGLAFGLGLSRLRGWWRRWWPWLVLVVVLVLGVNR